MNENFVENENYWSEAGGIFLYAVLCVCVSCAHIGLLIDTAGQDYIYAHIRTSECCLIRSYDLR